jgi:hypothetical protein
LPKFGIADESKSYETQSGSCATGNWKGEK